MFKEIKSVLIDGCAFKSVSLALTEWSGQRYVEVTASGGAFTDNQMHELHFLNHLKTNVQYPFEINDGETIHCILGEYKTVKIDPRTFDNKFYFLVCGEISKEIISKTKNKKMNDVFNQVKVVPGFKTEVNLAHSGVTFATFYDAQAAHHAAHAINHFDELVKNLTRCIDRLDKENGMTGEANEARLFLDRMNNSENQDGK